MPTPLARKLAALVGLLGTIMLLAAFTINPAPPHNPTAAELIAYSGQHHNLILIGAWLQAIAALLLVLFCVALVRLARATGRFAGLSTLVGGMTLILANLVEVTLYLSMVNSDPRVGLISLALLHDAVQYLYPVIAVPSLFLPLGVVILFSRVLPRIFGYVMLGLGGLFLVLGFFYLFIPMITVMIVLSVLQAFWFLAAAITLLVQKEQQASVSEVAKTTSQRDEIVAEIERWERGGTLPSGMRSKR